MNISDDQILYWISDASTVNKGFKALMDKYQLRLYNQIRRIVGTHNDTDDVLQNVFIKVFKNIKKFEQRSGLYTWLYRIAYNEAVTLMNKNKSKQSLSIDDDEYATVNLLQAEAYMDGQSIENTLLQALNTLPVKQKQVFEMRYYEEMSYQEISNRIGTSVGALKASYHHAVKKIEHFVTQLNSNL